MNTIDRILELTGEIEGILNAFKKHEDNPSKTACQCGDNKHHGFPNNFGVRILLGDLDDLVKELGSLIKHHLEDEVSKGRGNQGYDYGDFLDEKELIDELIPDGITKGALMKQVYTKEELGNIDASLPREIHLTYGVDAFFFVMNYNKNVFGELEDMRKLIKQPTTIVTGRVK